MSRDRVWADTYTAAERIAAKYGWPIEAKTRRNGLQTTQGLVIYSPVHFEPIRQRRLFARRWEDIQSVQSAANRIGELARDGRAHVCPDCGHVAGLHPGRVPMTACALCVADEDEGKIKPDEMCKRTFAPSAT